MRKLFKELYLELAPFGRFWFGLGMIALAAACAMSFFFGKSISLTHGVFLVVLSAVAAFGPHAAHKVFEMGKKNAGIALAILCAPLLLIEFYSHAGYTAGLRGTNLGDAKVQNAKYTTSYEAVDEDKKALAKTIADRDALKKAHPWAAMTTADALRADLNPIEVALKKEANNCGRRKCSTPDEGKGPAWQILAKQKADIEAKIAIAEDDNKYAIRIASLEQRVSAHREKATSTEFKHSSVAHQNEFLAKVVALVSTGSLKPDEITEASAEQSVNLAMAIAGTGLPALCFFIAGCFATGRREDLTLTKWAASGPEPAPTQMTKFKSSVRDAYERHCRTFNTGAIPRAV